MVMTWDATNETLFLPDFVSLMAAVPLIDPLRPLLGLSSSSYKLR